MSDLSPLETIFFAALEKGTPEERAAYLDEACAGDPDIRRRVEKMLAAQAEARSFLEQPATGLPMAEAGKGAATADAGATEKPGAVIGPYKLLEQIGEGGFGVVFMAEQTEPVRRKVALKILKPGMDTKHVVARFEAERQALAIMDHPNIAKVHDGGTTPPSPPSQGGAWGGGRPYFVMELVKGVPITAYCDQNHLTPRQRLELFIPICHAVQHAHQKGIIHRDLKPSNVLVQMHDSTPVPKIIDFGIAKALGQELTDKTLFTGFAQMIGTPLYMSPEQAGHSSLDIDTRSDIYSLGVLLYELLTGTTPFTKERFKQAAYDEIRRIIREEEPPRPSTRLSELDSPRAPREESGGKNSPTSSLASVAAQRQTEPGKLTKLVRGELDWIVMKALEKDRNRRYETASALAEDIHRYLHEEPVQACPPSVIYRFRKFVRRNKAAVAAAMVVVLSLFAVGVAGTLAHRNEQQRLADLKSHEDQLRAERQQYVLEKALMAAMSGDFDGAEKAIDEAELLGASTGQVRMLRGQIAYHRGDTDTAIRHLEQATQLIPDSVAAHAMLTLAYSHTGRALRMAETERILQTLSPKTPEDFLFKGQVEVLLPFLGRARTQNLDEAIRRRDGSVIARVVRTEAWANRALFFSDIADAEVALDDAQVARGMLPDNPLVLSHSVHAQLVASVLYEDLNRKGDSQRVLEQARRDVEKLRRCSLQFAHRACLWYFDYVGDEESAYQVARQGEFRLVPLLYRRGDFPRALEAAQRAVGGNNGLARIELGFVQAELPDGAARVDATFHEAMETSDDSRFYRMCAPFLLLLRGKKQEALQASLRIQQSEIPIGHERWYENYLDFSCGRTTAEELLKAAGPYRVKQSEAHFLLGLHRLADGDRRAAREHLRKCVQTRVFMYWEGRWARAFLARMEKDPAWPPWIPF